MKIRSVYDGERIPVTLSCDKGMTMQSFRDECDINNIIARYETTGFLVDPMIAARRTPSFGDFSKLPDYMEAQNIIAVGSEIFAALPARIREMFNNNPADYCNFVSNPDNLDKALELDLVDEVYYNAVKDSLAPKPSRKKAKKSEIESVSDSEPVLDSVASE